MKKTIAIVCTCMALCGMAAFGTYAYLSADAGTKENVFTSSKSIAAELTEKDFKPEDAAKYMPGDTYAKNPTILNKSTDEAIYVAIKVTYQTGKNDEGQQEVATAISKATFAKYGTVNGLSADWQLASTYADGSELYVFKTAVAPSKSATPELFQSVTVNPNIELVNGKLPTFSIKVQGYATQSTNMTLETATTELKTLAGL